MECGFQLASGTVLKAIHNNWNEIETLLGMVKLSKIIQIQKKNQVNMNSLNLKYEKFKYPYNN